MAEGLPTGAGRFDGRVVAITGGAGHIGRAFAAGFAALGAHVAIVDRAAAACAATADDLHARFGPAALGVPTDLEDEAQVRAIVPAVLGRFARLDTVIHCAALVGTTPLEGWTTPFAEQSVDTWRRAMAVNLTAPFLIDQAAAAPLAQAPNGSIIHLGSIYGVVGPQPLLYEGTGMANPAAYAATKGGLTQFSRWLSVTLAPAVRVNMISPGGIERGQDARFQARYVARTPLGRMGTEDDLVAAALYLAGDGARYVTGQNIVVDGGWTAW